MARRGRINLLSKSVFLPIVQFCDQVKSLVIFEFPAVTATAGAGEPPVVAIPFLIESDRSPYDL